MYVSKFNVKVIICFLFSLIYGVSLTLLPNELFRDRVSYINYAENSLDIMGRYDGLSLFTNEPLFLIINNLLSQFISPDVTPLVFVFFVSFTACYFILLKSKNIFFGILGILALLLIPQAFHMQFVVLRQALAASILVWIAYFLWDKRYFIPLVFFIGFIHSSMFMVFLFLTVDRVFIKIVSEKIVFRSFAAIFISALASFLILPIAELLAMRQADGYESASMGGSGGNFVLYSVILLITLTQYKQRFIHDGLYVIGVIGVSIYIGMYFFSPFAGRLITTFMPFIICLMCQFGNARAFLLLGLIVFINSLIFKGSIENNSLTVDGIKFLFG
ncbi:EpsG family protein [Aeromonas caviae]|uniref:EpsG family protein n=1 Tax=Aeromonas caviae TaxID=648 RepID=UPI002B47A5FF|nr:EpsG family protein [Aeromonas caviae]